MPFSAPEKIRTPDTTVRSRMLYPAELLTHPRAEKYFLNNAKIIIANRRAIVKNFFEKLGGNNVGLQYMCYN